MIIELEWTYHVWTNCSLIAEIQINIHPVHVQPRTNESNERDVTLKCNTYSNDWERTINIEIELFWIIAMVTSESAFAFPEAENQIAWMIFLMIELQNSFALVKDLFWIEN